MALTLVVSACASESPADTSTVVGIVTDVTGDLTVVESLVVMDADGRSFFFKSAPGLLLSGGPLSHLRDHVVTGQRVVVTFEIGADGLRTATLIEHVDSDAAHEDPRDDG